MVDKWLIREVALAAVVGLVAAFIWFPISVTATQPVSVIGDFVEEIPGTDIFRLESTLVYQISSSDGKFLNMLTYLAFVGNVAIITGMSFMVISIIVYALRQKKQGAETLLTPSTRPESSTKTQKDRDVSDPAFYSQSLSRLLSNSLIGVFFDFLRNRYRRLPHHPWCCTSLFRNENSGRQKSKYRIRNVLRPQWYLL
jgi:hypothetical protein